MRAIVAVVGALLIASAAAAAPACDFTAAVNQCGLDMSRCDHWRCIAKQCPSEFTFSLAAKHCASANANAPLRPAVAAPAAGKTDGSDATAKPAVARPPAVGSADQGVRSMPAVNSPCFKNASGWDESMVRAMLYNIAMDVYADRYNETYSEDMTLRWVGIHDHVCPSNVPRYSDCSSTVTWIYWSIFGEGEDFMNGEKWSAGYTGTLVVHGKQVDSPSEATLKVGDLCFYYHPMHHTAIYVGNGMVVSHGMDPVGFYSWSYAPVDSCRRYL